LVLGSAHLTFRRGFLAVLPIAICFATSAQAHTAARGFVLLLPTTFIIACGALAVAISFAALWMLPERWFLKAWPEVKWGVPAWLPIFTSCASFVLFLFLLWRGYVGSTDPLENALSLSMWTGWWVILVVLHPVFGNLWAWVNPFSGPLALTGSRAVRDVPGGDIIAVVIFAAFAWWQLVSVTPEDPGKLARILSVYAVLTFAGGLVFGRAWFERADPFFQMFRWLGAISPLGPRLDDVRPRSLFAMLLVIMLLGALSFDGFATSFLWLSTIGINPLDFPGRSAVMAANTIGLFGFILVVTLVFAAAVFVGWRLAGRPGSLREIAPDFVLSLIPVAIALHFAHFLTDALVNGQYLIGVEHPTTSFLNTASGVRMIYSVQAAAVLVGHVAGVFIAHRAVARMRLACGRAVLLELPMAALMIAYTAFSLWVLSTATAG
jgi:hypothetical protein